MTNTEWMTMPRARGQRNRQVFFGEDANEIMRRLADDNFALSDAILEIGRITLGFSGVGVREDRQRTFDIAFVRRKVFATLVAPTHQGSHQGTNIDGLALTIQLHGLSREDFPHLEPDGSIYDKGMLRIRVRGMEDVGLAIPALRASYLWASRT